MERLGIPLRMDRGPIPEEEALRLLDEWWEQKDHE
jgi:hypothetical protein